MPRRRRVLRTGGLVAAGTLAGIIALPSPQESPEIDRTVEGTEQGEDHDPPEPLEPWYGTDEPITDEDVAPVARFQYRATDSEYGYVATAPVNVVIVPAAETGGLERAMGVLEDAGWLRGPEEYTRYAWDRANGEYVRQEATAAETYYGTSGRLHVRCWEFEGVISVQAHEDTGARPKHGVASYERGRRAMASIYAADGWTISTAAIDLDNAQHDHDGAATVITESPEGAR